MWLLSMRRNTVEADVRQNVREDFRNTSPSISSLGFISRDRCSVTRRMVAAYTAAIRTATYCMVVMGIAYWMHLSTRIFTLDKTRSAPDSNNTSMGSKDTTVTVSGMRCFHIRKGVGISSKRTVLYMRF